MSMHVQFLLLLHVHVYTHYEVQVFAKSTERRASILFWVLILHGVVFEVHTYHVPLHRKRLRRIVSGLFPELESSILDELLPNKCSLETLRYMTIGVVNMFPGYLITKNVKLSCIKCGLVCVLQMQWCRKCSGCI